MTQEEKQILLIDLCARLPYGVKVKITDEGVLSVDSEKGTLDGKEIMSDDCFTIKCDKDSWILSYDEFKPYLRPMSSMTEEEREEFRTLIFPEASCAYEDCLEWDAQIIGGGYLQISVEDFSKVVDWLNENKFDYRGLIPMGLALEAPEGMYKFE